MKLVQTFCIEHQPIWVSDDWLKIAVVDVQFSYGSVALFKGSWLHQTARLPRIFIYIYNANSLWLPFQEILSSMKERFPDEVPRPQTARRQQPRSTNRQVRAIMGHLHLSYFFTRIFCIGHTFLHFCLYWSYFCTKIVCIGHTYIQKLFALVILLYKNCLH